MRRRCVLCMCERVMGCGSWGVRLKQSPVFIYMEDC